MERGNYVPDASTNTVSSFFGANTPEEEVKVEELVSSNLLSLYVVCFDLSPAMSIACIRCACHFCSHCA
eukprot:5432187-Amphidinium_carterae.1